jgi:hypothetical protein
VLHIFSINNNYRPTVLRHMDDLLTRLESDVTQITKKGGTGQQFDPTAVYRKGLTKHRFINHFRLIEKIQNCMAWIQFQQNAKITSAEVKIEDSTGLDLLCDDCG